jgi:hypothetical protein
MGIAIIRRHPCDDFEPLPDAPNDYRQAAIYHLQLMFAVDEFITAATDARVAVVAVRSHWVGLRPVA